MTIAKTPCQNVRWRNAIVKSQPQKPKKNTAPLLPLPPPERPPREFARGAGSGVSVDLSMRPVVLSFIAVVPFAYVATPQDEGVRAAANLFTYA